MERNKQTNEQTLNTETDNLPSWREELTKEVNDIERQSEKHAKKNDADQVMDLNEKDISSDSSNAEKKAEGTQEVPHRDSSENIKDIGSAELSHVHVADEHKVEDNSKSDEKDSSKQSDEIKTTRNDDLGEQEQDQESASSEHSQVAVESAEKAEQPVNEQHEEPTETHQQQQQDSTETQQQQQEPTETQQQQQEPRESQKEKAQADDSRQQIIDGAKEQLEEEGKGAQKTTGQYNSKKKVKGKKGRSRKKMIEPEEMDEWANEDDFGDFDDESYDEDFDEDVEDNEMEDLNEDTDSIDSWKMTEKPLDEAEDLGDEEDYSKLKEQEDLEEEIKHLKGFISAYFCCILSYLKCI